MIGRTIVIRNPVVYDRLITLAEQAGMAIDDYLIDVAEEANDAELDMLNYSPGRD